MLAPIIEAQEKSWSERFPEIARRVPHLDRRMAADDVEVRKRVLRTLNFVRLRDSKVYPPFFRALLKDPSPEIRGLAVYQLWEHMVFLDPKELPESFHVHFVDDFQWKDPKELARVRTIAQALNADGGWAIQALALVGDKEAIPLARAQLKSMNIFVRHSAALALVQLGQSKEGIEALHRITDAGDDGTGFYRYRAAECLIRLGERKAIAQLIEMMERKTRENYVDGPREILEDLTGQYFITAAEARAWWKKNGEKDPVPKRGGK